jgi:ATP dependent DNA ligase domain
MSCPQAATGYTRSSTTDFGSWPARKGAQVKLYSRLGNDLTYRFPLIVETLARLRSRSCIIDGEAVACDDNGVTLFNRVRYRRHDESIFLYAFDLIELNGDDLRRDPLEGRKATPPGVDTLTVGRGGPGVDTHKGRSWWGGVPRCLTRHLLPWGGQNPRRDALRLSASPAPIAR